MNQRERQLKALSDVSDIASNALFSIAERAVEDPAETAAQAIAIIQSILLNAGFVPPKPSEPTT